MSTEATPQRGLLPAIVIQQAIAQQFGSNAATDALRQTPPPPPPQQPPLLLRVEVETRQGYVYEGKLVVLDDDYNVSLAEATSWRDRLCDVERALLAAQGFPAPAASPATRRRYVGSVFIRSSNLFMLRFLQDEGSASSPTTSSNNNKAGGGAAATLKSAFKSMAVKVKRQINMERQKNRIERRQRLRLGTKAVVNGENGGGKTRPKRARRTGAAS
ncbi:hypothetical protein DQ04_00751060 [Trypanosoma grayi]|uniref:hypothetical protein n=1 Tax=Trypanosoma grayi TaxID=71804 RepID=UPI0004F49D9C|nr:hypothetical protein DQ04_00751060 [Trypanosoma grayi]KEG13846.1 hypothetical protein DQ04_00751060 [Trypanosoma grayi]